MKDSSTAKSGTLAQLVGPRDKRFFIRLHAGDQFQTHHGVLNHDDLIGLPWGSQVHSHVGKPFILIQPSLHDLLLNTRRNTTIMYPKDIGFIMLNMNIGPGARVVEAGSGSGAFTTALAFLVGETGQVISYEYRSEMQALAKKNIKRLGLEQQVLFKLRDIKEGFDESDVDALFLDLPNPWDYIPQVHQTLKAGGHFGSLLPTSNQVIRLLDELEHNPFALIEACEILLRYYKTHPKKIRPEDRMVAHTGFLIFARSMATPE
jgi:tRNA (adenine57-N1/adenine58-N1)-methyltransferase